MVAGAKKYFTNRQTMRGPCFGCQAQRSPITFLRWDKSMKKPKLNETDRFEIRLDQGLNNLRGLKMKSLIVIHKM